MIHNLCRLFSPICAIGTLRNLLVSVPNIYVCICDALVWNRLLFVLARLSQHMAGMLPVRTLCRCVWNVNVQVGLWDPSIHQSLKCLFIPPKQCCNIIIYCRKSPGDLFVLEFLCLYVLFGLAVLFEFSSHNYVFIARNGQFNMLVQNDIAAMFCGELGPLEVEINVCRMRGKYAIWDRFVVCTKRRLSFVQ